MVIRVFASGQSNMMGRGTGGPGWSGVDSRARVWNNINPLGANGSSFVTAQAARAAGTFEFFDRGNLAVWFAHRLAQIRSDTVNLTMVARGATAIESWRPGGLHAMLSECISVWNATGQPPADVFLWHQGEGNTGTPPSSYKADFLALVADLKAANVLDDDTLIILGGTAEENSSRINFNNNSLKSLADENTNILYASPVGLETYDGTHFTGGALYTMGAERYIAPYIEATGSEVEETDDLYAFVNEGGAPGVPGTGKNKVLNIKNLHAIGLDRKDTTTSPAFGGTPPDDKVLTAAMLAAGSVVDFGSSANGTWFRFESGLQICMWRGSVSYASQNFLHRAWTFPKPFIATPFIFMTANSDEGNTNMSTVKRELSLPMVQAQSPTSAGIYFNSSGRYTGGDEVFGAHALAIGFWK